jgi:threonine dehydrogenase-like Zn-dependent dehydrogenase
MKALVWCGKKNVHVENVPDPKILNPRDIIVKVQATAICGSDLHLFDGYIPTMRKGDILGHEFMGDVVEVGSEVRKHKVGDRVVVPFMISCGNCYFCRKGQYSCCDNTNPNAALGEQAFGFATCGMFGYSALTGGYAGGQAEYVRVPHADVGPIRVPDGVTDEQAVLLADVFPTGWQAAAQANIQPGDTVAVWGCGPVGLLAMKSAQLLGAERIVAIDLVEGRRKLAADHCDAETIDARDEYVYDRLRDITAGRGPDVCIDAVGMEAMGHTIDAAYDRIKTTLYMTTDRGHALRQAIHCCRKGGTLSMPGVYGGFMDKFPIGALMQKGLTVRTGQTHVPAVIGDLAGRVQRGEADPSFIVTHRMRLDDAAKGYDEFAYNQTECVKVVLKPS